MKKVFNSKIFIFALGMIVMASIGIGAYAINASEIIYNSTTVDQALDDLYTKANSKPDFGTPIYSQRLSTMLNSSRTQELTLDKGKYILLLNYDVTYGVTTANIESANNSVITINCTSCEYDVLSDKIYQRSASTEYVSNYYMYDSIKNSIIYLEVKDNQDTISYTYQEGFTNGACPSIINLTAIPII